MIYDEGYTIMKKLSNSQILGNTNFTNCTVHYIHVYMYIDALPVSIHSYLYALIHNYVLNQ